MAIQSISDSQAWNDFLKITSSARERNEAFILPKTSSKGAVSSFQVAENAGASRGYLSKSAYSTPQQAVSAHKHLGTLFDAYA